MTDLSSAVVKSPLLPDGVTPLSAPAIRTMGEIVGGWVQLNSYRGLTRNGTTDDSSAYASALSDAMRLHCGLWHGPGPICLKGGTVLPVVDSVMLGGEGVDCQQPPYGGRGTSFWIYDQANPTFSLNTNVRMNGLSFFWPDQKETGKPPIACPPLFSGASSTRGFSACSFEKLRITNAYDIWVADQPSQMIGDISVQGVRACALNDVFRVSNVPEVVNIADCLFSYESYDYVVNQYGVGSPTFGLRDWVTSKGSVFHVRNTQSNQVAYFKVSNTYIYGFGRAAYVEPTGRLWFSFDGVDIDGCPQVLQVDAGGTLATCAHRSGIVFPYRVGYAGPLPPLWNIQAPSSCDLLLGAGVRVQGVGTPITSAVAITNAKNARVDMAFSVADFTPASLCSIVAVTGDVGGIYRIEGMRVIPAGGSYVGVQFTGSKPQLARIKGNYFHAPTASIKADGGGAAFHVAENSSLYTVGTSDVLWSGGSAAVPGAWNAWSKP